MAFGATKQDVFRVIVVRGLKPTAVGIAAGFVAAIALGRVVTSMVYGISSRDTAATLSIGDRATRWCVCRWRRAWFRR